MLVSKKLKYLFVKSFNSLCRYNYLWFGHFVSIYLLSTDVLCLLSYFRLVLLFAISYIRLSRFSIKSTYECFI